MKFVKVINSKGEEEWINADRIVFVEEASNYHRADEVYTIYLDSVVSTHGDRNAVLHRRLGDELKQMLGLKDGE